MSCLVCAGKQADIFSPGTFNNYASPPGFCFDILCRDEPIIDNVGSTEYNVKSKVDDFIKYVLEQGTHYRSNNILITMGEDFQFQDAGYHFKNLDKLIRYVNERQESGSEVNVFYSTPSCYVKSLHDANLTWPTKQDDFFPYASDQHAYWTGYFTSRPTLKYFERQGNNFLQITKQLAVLGQLAPEEFQGLDEFREVMGIMQHHDAVVGTEKQHVADDYARQLTQAFRKGGQISSVALNKLLTLDQPEASPLLLRSCPLSNISDCSISSQAENFIVTVYNPLSRTDTHYVRLPVDDAAYVVRDSLGEELTSQVVPIPLEVMRIPGRTATSEFELIFKAADLLPLGYRSYYVSKSTSKRATSTKVSLDKPITILNKNLKVRADASGFTISDLQETVTVSQRFEYYLGALGDNSASEKRSSGAYIFRPQEGTESIKIGDVPILETYEGDVLTEIHVLWSDWASNVVRMYRDSAYVELEWLVGPIPIDDGNGKEIISKLVSNINSSGTFYTDSNGRQTIQRKRDFRPTWDLDSQEPIAGNYYPVTTDVSIDDGTNELVVIVDRAQGASSLRDGELELMVHRRLLHDDAFGVGEALNETAFGKGLVARGTHWITIGPANDKTWLQQKRLLQQEKLLDSYVTLIDAGSMDFDTWVNTYKLQYSGLMSSLPDAVHILTLEPWRDSTILLRLENIFDTAASPDPVTVNLEGLFNPFNIISARETTLAGDRWIEESTRFEWQKDTNEIPQLRHSTERSTKAVPEVTLNPKQIRTFVCEIQNN